MDMLQDISTNLHNSGEFLTWSQTDVQRHVCLYIWAKVSQDGPSYSNVYSVWILRVITCICMQHWQWEVRVRVIRRSTRNAVASWIYIIRTRYARSNIPIIKAYSLADSLVSILRFQWALLHCSISFVLFFSYLIPGALPATERIGAIGSTRQSGQFPVIEIVLQSMECWSIRACSCKQDWLNLAVETCSYLGTSDGRQADNQCCAIGQSESLAGGRWQRGSQKGRAIWEENLIPMTGDLTRLDYDGSYSIEMDEYHQIFIHQGRCTSLDPAGTGYHNARLTILVPTLLKGPV